MTTNRHFILAIVAGVLIAVVGGALLVWPNYKRAGEMEDRIERLRAKSRDQGMQDQLLNELRADLAEETKRIDELKLTPSSANIADLMGRLSLRPDGITVLDQSFTTGQANDAVPGSELTAQATPLTVEITGRFDSIFALIRSVETMNRLVRVASISLDRNAPEGADAFAREDESPVITATIGLEAIFDPGVEEAR